jgi:hypothetical protein
MNPDHIADDHLTAVLASLPRVDVAPAHADRVRARCRATLHGRADAGRAWPPAAGPVWTRILEPALVAGISGAFLLEVVGRALSLEGF